jgi:hypothetical protein
VITELVNPRFAVARCGGRLAHLVRSTERHIWNDKVALRAEWACGENSCDVALLDSGDDWPQKCERCLHRNYVYRCFDDAGRLIYIGSTCNEYSRFTFHRGRTPWWPSVARVKKEEYPTLFEARQAEAKAIAAEQPLHNRYGKAVA